MIDKAQTGKKIAIFRKRQGMSQSDLAEKLGVSTQAVSKWECAQSLPDTELLTELSDWLKHCENCGYIKTECEKLYDELPAPNTNIFPFPNAVMQWMCSYVSVSTK